MSTTLAARPLPWGRWLVGATALVALLLLLAAPIVAGGEAAGHAWFHVTLSLVGLVPAIVLALRRPRGGSATTAPIIGLVLLAGTQLIEGIGALGWAPDGLSRVNGLADLHDLGLLIAPIGLIVGAVGVVIGIGRLIGNRTKRPVLAFVVAVAVLLPFLAMIAKLMGM